MKKIECILARFDHRKLDCVLNFWLFWGGEMKQKANRYLYEKLVFSTLSTNIVRIPHYAPLPTKTD